MKSRIITASLIALIVVPFIFIGGIPYLIAISFILGVTMSELLKVNKSPIWVQILSVLMVLGATIYSYFNIDKLFIDLNALFVVVPFFTFFTIAIFDKKRTLLDAVYNTLMTIVMILFGIALLELRFTFNNVNLLLYVLITTIAVDTFALFIGCKFGKHKLNKRISPKKSIEGAIGGTVCGVLIGTLFAVLFPITSSATNSFINIGFDPNFDFINILQLLAITFALTIIGQIGDLAFSMIKRHFDVKDFSNILPGHGGFGDRVDSACFNTIALASILSLFLIL